MKRFSVKKLVGTLAVAAALSAAAVVSASACTTIYVGGNLTQEGTPFVARTEDYGADMNKMWRISEAGAFDGLYKGCPGDSSFTYELSHPSYRFTYFKNDNEWEGNVCPECGEADTLTGPNAHLSYTEFGTNEWGLSVSGTETLKSLSAVTKLDPFLDTGIEETDIPTILLSEARTAREAVELYTKISDEQGHAGCDGVFIMDQNEIWYVENCSGTQYVGIKLNDDLIFFEPNMAVIGEIDLDDTENVIASDRLIEIAQQAGTFEGNEEENIINFRLSYCRNTSDARLVDGLNFINKENNYSANGAALIDDNSLFCISNVKDGGISPMYTNIRPDRVLTKDDVFNYYKLSSVGKPSNQEIEIFQLFADRPVEEGTVGWVGVGNMSYNVFVPCYPMLLTDLYKGYQVSTPVVNKTTDKPDGFATWTTKGGGMYVEYPENWRDSFYFSFEGLGGYIQYAEQINGAPVSDADKQYALDRLNALQQEFCAEFDAMNPRRTTKVSADMSKRAHMLALELIDYLTDSQAPAAPDKLKIQKVYNTGATVTWRAAGDNVGIGHYVVQVFRGDQLVSTQMTTGLSCDLSGLEAGTWYTVSVAAVDKAGNTSSASSDTFQTFNNNGHINKK